MKSQVVIVVHYACNIQDIFEIWKQVPNRKVFVRCDYGLDLRYTGFSTTVHAPPHRVQRITAKHRTVRFLKNITRTAPQRTATQRTATHRNAPPHRTAPYDSQKKKRTEPHRVISKIEKPHHGAVLHREKPCKKKSFFVFFKVFLQRGVHHHSKLWLMGHRVRYERSQLA